MTGPNRPSLLLPPRRPAPGPGGPRGRPVLRHNPVRQRGAWSSARRRPGCTGNRTLRKPERIAPCRLRSRRETLTYGSGRRATASPPRGGLATQRWLSDGKHWGVGAPGGTRTPGIRLRSPSTLRVFSTSCRTGSTLEGTNRLERSAPPTRLISSASERACREADEAGLSAGIISLRDVLDVVSSHARGKPPRGLLALAQRRHLRAPGARDRRWFKSGAGVAECYTVPATYWVDLVRQ